MIGQILIWDKDGVAISRCKNLRAMRAYGNKHGIECVVLCQLSEGAGAFSVHYETGAVCRSHFASYAVMVSWFKRWKAAQTARYIYT